MTDDPSVTESRVPADLDPWRNVAVLGLHNHTADQSCDLTCSVYHRSEPVTELWWLSFVDTSLPFTEEGNVPGGPRWAGACIVEGPTFMDAVRHAWEHGCNPGGEVKGYPTTAPPDPSFRNRLLSRADVDAIDRWERP